MMDLSNQHNLRGPHPDPGSLRFGIRVTMPARDPLRAVLGNDWHKEHWFASAAERDEALLEMGKRHAYSRIGDDPSIRLEPLDR
jgi:hypothetical protein